MNYESRTEIFGQQLKKEENIWIHQTNTIKKLILKLKNAIIQKMNL